MTRHLSLALIFMLAVCPAIQAGLVSFDDIFQSGQGPGDPPAPYGPPTIVGNTLSFEGPAAFSATSVNGVFDIEDSFTDGLLTFSVNADPDTWITGIVLSETGGTKSV